MKAFEMLKKIGRRCKAGLVACAVAASCALVSVCACAEDVPGTPTPVDGVDGVDMGSILADAGTQMTAQFGTLVSTLIPVIIGVLTAGLAIFGIMQLIKLCKKTFGKVAG